MKVHAEAKPLTEPLPGGKQGATVTVEPLSGGEVQFPAASFERPGGPFESLKVTRRSFTSRASGWLWVPCPAFLITHPTAGPILVDTSLHSSVAAKPARTSAAWPPGSPARESSPGKDLPSQLRERGADPRSISLVVMTHLHIDHASGISEFPSSTFVLSSAEWEAATTGSRPLLRGYRPAALRLRLRLPAGRLRRAADRLLLDLRPHLRPVRRRQHQARLHPRPHARPHVRARPPSRPRLRDRRRRRLHDAPARGGPGPPRPTTRTSGAARSRSCSCSTAQYPQAVIVARPRPRALGDARREVRLSESRGRGLAALSRPGPCARRGRPIPSRSDLDHARAGPSPRAPGTSRAPARRPARRPRAAARGSGSATTSKLIGSPYWTVTFGNRSLRHLRTPSEPWIATGTTGTPDSSAIRPTPGRGSPSPPLRERPPSGYISRHPPRSEDRVGGLECLLVVVAAPDREGAPVAEDELDHRVREQLRLGHEADLPAHVDGGEEVVPLAEVVRGEDHGPRGGHVLGADRAGAVEEQGRRRQDDPRHVVDPVGLVGAGALVEPRRSTPRGAGPCRPGA